MEFWKGRAFVWCVFFACQILLINNNASMTEDIFCSVCKHGSDGCFPTALDIQPTVVTLPFWELSHLVILVKIGQLSIYENLKQVLVAGCPSWRQPATD